MTILTPLDVGSLSRAKVLCPFPQPSFCRKKSPGKRAVVQPQGSVLWLVPTPDLKLGQALPLCPLPAATLGTAGMAWAGF